MQKKLKPFYRKEGYERLFRDLRTEANIIVATLGPERRPGIIIKSFLFPTFYFASWGIAMTLHGTTSILFTCYALMGICLVLNYLNIIHDAVHHTIFKSRVLNNTLVYVFDLMGANSYIWKTRHIKYHHNYPNVDGWDTDIDQSNLIRVTPHAPVSKFHKYQHLYIPFLYPLFLFNWLLIRDFKDFFGKNRIVRRMAAIPILEYIKLFIFKLLFVGYMVLIPIFIFHIDWEIVLIAFFIMIQVATFSALLVLLPPHANTGADFPVPGPDQDLPYSWFYHMLITTNDVNGENWFTRFVLGNYNYHVVHHLFPNIHHAYYPEITQVLKKMAIENDLPYRSYPLFTALKNHYLLLKQNRGDFDVWEESM